MKENNTKVKHQIPLRCKDGSQYEHPLTGGSSRTQTLVENKAPTWMEPITATTQGGEM